MLLRFQQRHVRPPQPQRSHVFAVRAHVHDVLGSRSVVVLRDLAPVPSPSLSRGHVRDRGSYRLSSVGFRALVLGAHVHDHDRSLGFPSYSQHGCRIESQHATRPVHPASVCSQRCWVSFVVRVLERSLKSAKAGCFQLKDVPIWARIAASPEFSSSSRISSVGLPRTLAMVVAYCCQLGVRTGGSWAA